MAQPSVFGLARQHPLFRVSRNRRQCQGISLTELLIGVVIAIVVLGATVRVLVSFIRSDSASQVELNRKDEVGRVLGLMQDEIRNAQRVENGNNLTALGGCTTAPQLILRGASANEDISYALTAQTANTTWRGPAVLVRCGLPYSDTGVLDTTASRGQQVVLDSLTANGFSTTTAGGSVNRSVELTLISNAASNVAITNRLQVPISENRIYGLLSTGASQLSSSGLTVGTVTHWQPSGTTTINGSSSREDVVYFPGRKNQYTISGASVSDVQRCVNSDNVAGGNCIVTSTASGGPVVTINSGNVLVFMDERIRLPDL